MVTPATYGPGFAKGAFWATLVTLTIVPPSPAYAEGENSAGVANDATVAITVALSRYDLRIVLQFELLRAIKFVQSRYRKTRLRIGLENWS
ncbi:unannotated protein [freshwater metagenome]|uniref:Unannotated protein n=1 Tax=freshwater metagenome TaxID=449393 RepID=A0A6J6VN51_9ZZZZ